MSKRPSLIADLKLSTPEPDPAPPPEAATATPAAARPAGRKPRPDIVHTSVYIPKPVYQKLREIAFTTDQKIHDIIMEGVDAALRRYGHPSIAELKGTPAKKNS